MLLVVAVVVMVKLGFWQLDRLHEKQALADLVVGDGEGWLTELSTGDLRQVFELSKEAVGE